MDSENRLFPLLPFFIHPQPVSEDVLCLNLVPLDKTCITVCWSQWDSSWSIPGKSLVGQLTKGFFLCVSCVYALFPKPPQNIFCAIFILKKVLFYCLAKHCLLREFPPLVFITSSRDFIWLPHHINVTLWLSPHIGLANHWSL